MGAMDPRLDLWSHLGPDERAFLAQQQQQSYANLDASKMQASYSHGWTDPTLYVFGGNDPQRAYTAIQNTPEELHKHLLGNMKPITPVKARTKIIVLALIGAGLTVVPVFLKLKGVI